MCFNIFFSCRVSSKADIQKFGDVLLDFAYFQSPDSCSKKIETNEVGSKQPFKNIATVSICLDNRNLLKMIAT